jgi:TRAP-type C4-dicarboxylate transport system permease small subunit
MKKFISAFSAMASWLSKFSAVALLIISVLVCVHIILRGFFNSGVAGIYEIVQYGMLMIVSFTLAENELTSGSVIVNFLLDRMKPRTANVVGIFMYCLTICGMIYVFINQIKMVAQKYTNGAVTAVLLIPHWILIIIVCVGIFFFTIAFVIKVYNMIKNHRNIENVKLTNDEKAANMQVTSEF